MKFIKRLLSLFRPKSELYVFGSSILWGQGHLPDSKIDRKVGRFIETGFKERVSIHLLAHSGALLDGDPPTAQTPIHGEVPAQWPSVSEQIRNAPRARSERVRILIEGGINEVGGVRISSPGTSPDYIERATEGACYRDFKKVLAQLTKRFPKAEIYVLGYYQILADRTGKKDVEDMLDREGLAPVEEDDFDLAERAIDNTQLFRERSDHWLKKACEEVPKSPGRSCIFVESGFTERDGMFGKPTLLFHPWSNDPMMGNRARQCTIALAKRQTGLHCFLAATAHPNEEGIDRYVENITAAIDSLSRER